MPLVGRPRLEKGMVVVDHQQPTPVQAGPSLPSSVVDEDTGADQARPPRVKSRPAARKAAKKRKALESEDESGGEIDKERKKKVHSFILCARSRLLMCDVFYRGSSATAPESTPRLAVCLL